MNTNATWIYLPKTRAYLNLAYVHSITPDTSISGDHAGLRVHFAAGGTALYFTDDAQAIVAALAELRVSTI